MVYSELYTGNPTVGTSEYSCTNGSTVRTNQTTDAVIQPRFNLSTLATGDQYQFRLYEKVRGADSESIFFESVISGAQSQALVFPPIQVGNGWDVTIKKLAGTDRVISFSIWGIT